jgi:hypothetical protein
MVPWMAFSAKWVMGLPKANGRVFLHQLFQSLEHGHFVFGFGLILESTS